jgi:hypothetical protein
MSLPTIFVSIASYRDPRCHQTVEHAFQQARHPNRVFMGICQQNKKGDPECLSNSFHWKKNVEVQRLDYTEARGPTYARFRCTQMYKDQDFFFQIDSHCLFVKDYSIAQRKSLYKLLESSGIDKKILYRKFTTLPQSK